MTFHVDLLSQFPILQRLEYGNLISRAGRTFSGSANRRPGMGNGRLDSSPLFLIFSIMLY